MKFINLIRNVNREPIWVLYSANKRLFHFSSINLTEDQNIYREIKPLTQEEHIKLLNYLDEILKNSNQMTASEQLSESLSTFDEVLPNSLPLKLIEELNNSKGHNIFESDKTLYGILSPLVEMTKSNSKELTETEKLVHFMVCKKFINGDFGAILKRINEDVNILKENSKEQFFINKGNGQFQLNVDSTKLTEALTLAESIFKDYNISVGGAIIPGISLVLIYRSIVKLNHRLSLESLNRTNNLSWTPVEKIMALENLYKKQIVFNRWTALLGTITIGVLLDGLVKRIKSDNPITIRIEKQNVEKPFSEKNQTKFISFFSLYYNKYPKWFKILTAILLIIILLYFINIGGMNIYYIVIEIRNFLIKWYSLFCLTGTSIFIIYLLLELYLLILFSLNIDIKINKYIPNFIKSYLLKLKELGTGNCFIILIKRIVEMVLSLFIIFLILIIISFSI